MAKTKGPLMSLDAHGSLGRVLTYSHRKSGRQVRAYNKPLVVASAKQRGQRRLTEFLVAQWQNMSAGDKATWETNARLSSLNITGYHFFLREAQHDLYTHTGLVGYWHCNEIVGGKVLDLSGNANHGTLEPGYPANAPVLVDSYKTRFGKALLYDGVDEYVSLGNANMLNIVDEFTITFVFYPKAAGWSSLITRYTSVAGAHYGYDITFSPTRQVGWGIRTGVADEWDFILGAALPLNKWYIGTVVRKPSFQGIYINGILDISKVPEYSPSINDVDTVIGNRNMDLYFSGRIDEVCIYNRALSAAEILTRYKFATRGVD